MRMWLVDRKIMCRQHLLGEHLELHFFIGHMKRKKSIKGYLVNNCLQINEIYNRHEELVNEMKNRGYNHKSELEKIDLCYYKEFFNVKINTESSKLDLKTRCNECQKLMN
jgi:hypothetical protein